jgi:hypothetical protein
MIPTVIAPHPSPLAGRGDKGAAWAGRGSSGLISNQADMISFVICHWSFVNTENFKLMNLSTLLSKLSLKVLAILNSIS